MRPGRSASDDGFLGPDESLADVLAHDQATVGRLGVTHLQLASVLQMFAALARLLGDRLGRDGGVEFDFNGQRWKILPMLRWSGGVESPIDGRAYYAQFRVENLSTDMEMPFMELHPLLGARGFWEGRKEPERVHRLDPEMLYEFLNGNQPPRRLQAELARLGFPD
jgi:hypothetical protein